MKYQKTKKLDRPWEFGVPVIAVDFKQRAFDNKWERLIKTNDYANRYTFIDENGKRVSLVPEKWLVVGVYDYLMEYVDHL